MQFHLKFENNNFVFNSTSYVDHNIQSYEQSNEFISTMNSKRSQVGFKKNKSKWTFFGKGGSRFLMVITDKV